MAQQKGTCYLCGASYAKAGMKTHILKQHAEGDQACKLIKIEGGGPFWLYVDMPETSTLATLDQFMRAIWLECCGHLSAFYLGRGYSGDELPVTMKINKLPDGVTLTHEYDFGSTTETKVTILGSTVRPKQRSAVRLLARNDMPEIQCDECENPAVYINTEEWPATFLCETCAEEADEELLLPVVNSPRMGVCSYCGELDVYQYDPRKAKK